MCLEERATEVKNLDLHQVQARDLMMHRWVAFNVVWPRSQSRRSVSGAMMQLVGNTWGEASHFTLPRYLGKPWDPGKRQVTWYIIRCIF